MSTDKLLESMPISFQLTLILTVLLAAYFDLRTRRIPNWINVAGILLGFSLNTYFHGWHGSLVSIEGALAALCIYIPLYALKGMGAGDAKLMAAIGAIAGPGNWFNIFIVTALLGGLAAVALVLLRRKGAQTLHNISIILAQLSRGKQPVQQDAALSIHHTQSLKMPHGAVIASGVCLFLLFHRSI